VKRVTALGSLCALVGAAVVPLLPHTVSAALCSQPSESSLSVPHATSGSTVLINGTGFTSFGCSLSVTVGGTAVPASANSSSQIQFTVPSGGVSGVVSVSLVDSANARNTDAHLVFVTDPPASGTLSNAQPTVGTPVQLAGRNFDFHLSSGLETYSAQYLWTQGSSNGTACPGLPSSAPTLANATTLNVPMTTKYCDGAVVVTLTAPLDINHTASGDAHMSFQVSAPFDIKATVTEPSSFSGVAGQNVTVSGTGFDPIHVGSVTVNGTPASVSLWKDIAVSFVVPPDATSGPVVLRRAVDGATFGPSTPLSISASAGTLSPSKAAVGDSVTVDGAGFGTDQGTVSIGSTAATVDTWSPTSIVFTVPPDAVTGPVDITPSGNAAPANPPTLTVIPKITGITPGHATAGSLIEIDGTTFGTSQGTVQIAGQSAQVTLWGDTSVLALIPNVSAGTVTVVLTPPGADAASFPYVVDAPPTAKPQPSSSSSSGAKPSATPGIIPPNPAGPVISHGPVNFVKPSPPPGPVSLKLDSSATQADPGKSVDFTVTLMAFGKPIVGAPVDLLMVIEPGSDASIDPSHAVTDAQGQVHGTIHLSRTAGDHIVLARSGIYSDEIRVVGRGAKNTVASGRAPAVDPGAPSSGVSFLEIRSPVLWALVTCLLLFGLGFGLNLATAPAGAAAGAAGGTMVRLGVAGTLRRSAAMLGDAARFGGGLVAVAGALTVGRLRGLRG
jgi:IPT/TIG domain